jgi:hypothetical protein
MVLAAPILAHLTFENCCPAERIDFRQPLPRRWRGNNRADPFLQVAELEERLTDVLALAAHWGALVNPNHRRIVHKLLFGKDNFFTIGATDAPWSTPIYFGSPTCFYHVFDELCVCER